MGTYAEANQAKLSLKMALSNYAWYHNIVVSPDGDDWCILVSITNLDNSIRKIIPIVHRGFSVKVDVDTQTKKKK